MEQDKFHEWQIGRCVDFINPGYPTLHSSCLNYWFDQYNGSIGKQMESCLLYWFVCATKFCAIIACFPGGFFGAPVFYSPGYLRVLFYCPGTHSRKCAPN